MIKLFTLWNRRLEQTHHEAVDYWTRVHAPKVVASHGPRLLRYACNGGVSADYSGWSPDEAPAWDGVAEGWYDFDDPAELAALITATSARLRASEREFIGTLQHVVTDQRVHVDRGRAQRGVKVLFMLTRRPERAFMGTYRMVFTREILISGRPDEFLPTEARAED